MTPTDITRVQTYLRRILGSDKIKIVPPGKSGLSVEVTVDDEVLGTVHRDEEEGEVSFSLQIVILDEDLPPPAKIPARPKK